MKKVNEVKLFNDLTTKFFNLFLNKLKKVLIFFNENNINNHDKVLIKFRGMYNESIFTILRGQCECGDITFNLIYYSKSNKIDVEAFESSLRYHLTAKQVAELCDIYDAYIYDECSKIRYVMKFDDNDA